MDWRASIARASALPLKSARASLRHKGGPPARWSQNGQSRKMIKATDKKLSERQQRQHRLAQQLRSNLKKRKAQSRARTGADSGSERSAAGDRAPGS